MLSLPHALRFLLATAPAALTRVLGTAYRTIAGYLLRTAGLTRTTGAVMVVQRFGSALTRNVHVRLLFREGASRAEGVAASQLRPVREPDAQELQALVEQIELRIGRSLEQCDLIERDLHAGVAIAPGSSGCAAT